MIDPFGRRVTYLRLSVTDRCDLRCVYCMAERMTFLPKDQLLTYEELDRLCSAFIRKGVRKLRLTGGEPLVRADILELVRALSRHLASGDLDELTLTTNGSRLAQHAEALAALGVKRVNVSVDSLEPATYRRITRRGDLARVLSGIERARAAGLQVKINTVALKHDNHAELPAMIEWAHRHGMDLTLIETMPMGAIDEDRTDQFLSLRVVREELEARWTLTDVARRTGGPARFVRVEETGGLLGFITPLTHEFCGSCNRVRVTCTGQLYTCLGRNDVTDLRAALRTSDRDAVLEAAIDEAIGRKPKGHDFVIERRAAPPAVARHMSVTGG